MELDTLKAALRETKFDGYLFERPMPEIALDMETKVRDMTAKQRQRDIQRILGGALAMALWFLLLDHRQPWWTVVGIALMSLGSALEIVCYLRLSLQDRRIQFDLPRQSFPAEERRRLAARARIIRRDVAWSAVPLLVGGLLYFLPQMEAAADVAVFQAMALV